MARLTYSAEFSDGEFRRLIQALEKLTDLLSSIKAEDLARGEQHEQYLDNGNEAEPAEKSLVTPTDPSPAHAENTPPKTDVAEKATSIMQQSRYTAASKDDNDLISRLDSHRLSPQLRETQPTSVRLPMEIKEFLVGITTEYSRRYPGRRPLSYADVINFALRLLMPKSTK